MGNKPDVRALLARLQVQSQTLLGREIVAPLLPRGRIRIRLDGLVHEFISRQPFCGWGRFRSLNDRTAELVGAARPWERAAYLDLFPALRMILLWPADARQPGTWWAMPHNASDARQRFGFAGEPLPIFLCDPTGGADRFERVVARVDGRILWYDAPDVLADPMHADWLREAAARGESPAHYPSGLDGSARFALLHWQLHELERSGLSAEGSLASSVQGGDRWLESRLRLALARADAVLHDFSVVWGAEGHAGSLVVEWSMLGERYRYRSVLDGDLTVASSGICLSGRDRDFDLTSLVSVMRDAESHMHP